MRKLLFVAAVTTVALLPHKAQALTCVEECNLSYQSCPTVCTLPPGQCFTGYRVCIDSCKRGVGPWLLC